MWEVPGQPRDEIVNHPLWMVAFAPVCTTMVGWLKALIIMGYIRTGKRLRLQCKLVDHHV